MNQDFCQHTRSSDYLANMISHEFYSKSPYWISHWQRANAYTNLHKRLLVFPQYQILQEQLILHCWTSSSPSAPYLFSAMKGPPSCQSSSLNIPYKFAQTAYRPKSFIVETSKPTNSGIGAPCSQATSIHYISSGKKTDAIPSTRNTRLLKHRASCESDNSSDCCTEIGMSESLQVLWNILHAHEINKRAICVSSACFKRLSVCLYKPLQPLGYMDVFINIPAMPPFLLLCNTPASQRSYIRLPGHKILAVIEQEEQVRLINYDTLSVHDRFKLNGVTAFMDSLLTDYENEGGKNQCKFSAVFQPDGNQRTQNISFARQALSGKDRVGCESYVDLKVQKLIDLSVGEESSKTEVSSCSQRRLHWTDTCKS